MAEISVPAWPMPIHQTKLMIAKPQATGMLMPQMPTPRANSQTSDSSSTMTIENETPSAPTHHSGVLPKTTLLTWSVIEPASCPGAITGGS
jgi:hypothetical protein